MLFLSVKWIFTAFLVWASPQQNKVEKLMQEHVQTVGGDKIQQRHYAASFKSFLDDEKKIYRDCATARCQVNVTIKKMNHKPDLWMAEVDVTLIQGKKRKPITLRPGCYFVENLKLVTYMEDCRGR